jgi:hypothetical protein
LVFEKTTREIIQIRAACSPGIKENFISTPVQNPVHVGHGDQKIRDKNGCRSLKTFKAHHDPAFLPKD